MRNPYKTYEQLKEFSKRIGIDVKKLETEMIKYNCREVIYNPFNDEVMLMMSDCNAIYIKRINLK